MGRVDQPSGIDGFFALLIIVASFGLQFPDSLPVEQIFPSVEMQTFWLMT